MFEALARPVRQRPQPRQVVFPLFFGAGLLLNLIASINRPPHLHHGVWFWLSLFALTLMAVGIAFHLREFFLARSARRRAALQQQGTS